MRMLSNKKGIELSINFIVLLILAIAVFAGGLVFVSKFFGQAEKMRGSLDSQTEKQIEKLLDSGSPVVIPINVKTINRGNYDTFGIGVLSDKLSDYKIEVVAGRAIDPEKNNIDENPIEFSVQPDILEDLGKNQKGKSLVLVNVPKGTKKGTYIFDVKVFAGTAPSTWEDTPYDNPLQFIVKVP